MNYKNIKKLASSCELCSKEPCQVGCPLDNDISKFIKKIRDNNYKEAFNVLSNTTVLMSVCGRICPHFRQCQGSCIKAEVNSSVEIGKLEAFIGDMALDSNWNYKSPKETKYNVAVVGAGPAGLTCAAFLRKNGIGVTLYEKHDYLGGLLVHGIPEFRLPKDIVTKVTTNIVNLGIDVKYNMELGKNITIPELKKKHDAIFIGIGANIPNKMNIDGEKLKGVFGANELLERKLDIDYNEKTVIVVGGGNVSMDVARVAKRNGAKKVILTCRSKESEMTADIKEIEDTKNDDVEIRCQTNIVRITGDNHVEKVELVNTEKIVDENGVSKYQNIEGSNYAVSCDYVIIAIGSHSINYVKKLGLDLNNRDKLLINKFGQTSDESIFSGGDVSITKGTVAWAARAGRNAAYGIIDYLNNKNIAKPK